MVTSTVLLQVPDSSASYFERGMGCLASSQYNEGKTYDEYKGWHRVDSDLPRSLVLFSCFLFCLRFSPISPPTQLDDKIEPQIVSLAKKVSAPQRHRIMGQIRS